MLAESKVRRILHTMKKQFFIIFCLVLSMSCSYETYELEISSYDHPSWISSDLIAIIECYKHTRFTRDAWGNVVEKEFLLQRIAWYEVDLSGNIVKKTTLVEDEHTSVPFSCYNTSAAGDHIFADLSITDEISFYEMFRINRNNNELMNLGSGCNSETSTDGLKIVYDKMAGPEDELWMKNVDGSGNAICLADSVDYGAWGPDNLIAYCWHDTLFVVDTTGTIQYKWYAGARAYRPDWSSSPDTVLISTDAAPRLIALANGSSYDLPLNLGSHIRWSPDGTRFMYRETSNYWCLIDRDGSNRVVLNWDE